MDTLWDRGQVLGGLRAAQDAAAQDKAALTLAVGLRIPEQEVVLVHGGWFGWVADWEQRLPL